MSAVIVPGEEHPVKRRRRLRTLLIILGVLVAIRIVLPYVLLHVVNDKLAKLDGYYGHVEDLNLALLRGAYQLEDLFIDQVDSASGVRSPFLGATLIDLSIEWKALLNGSVVGELVLEEPRVVFTKDAVEPAAVQKDTTTFRDLLDDLMPIRVNRIEAHDGTLRFKDPTTKPRVDVQMTDIDLLALNLRNSYDSTSLLPASLRFTSALYGGAMDFNMRLNPLAEQPTFDLNSELKNMELPQLNDFMQAYGKFDVNRGTFGLYTEVAAKDGGFTGYVKPLIQDLDVVGHEDRGDNLLRKLWEGVVGTAGVLFRNQREDQVATKVRFEGRMDGPRTNVLYAVIDLLRNAFFQALQPAVDNQINIRSVTAPPPEKKGFLKELFKKNEDKPRKKKS